MKCAATLRDMSRIPSPIIYRSDSIFRSNRMVEMFHCEGFETAMVADLKNKMILDLKLITLNNSNPQRLRI